MTFINTIPVAESEGPVRDMYQKQQDAWGFVPNYAKVFSHHPELMARWGRLLAEIKRNADPRIYELATWAASHELRFTPCAIEHGKQLATFMGEDTVIALAEGKFPEELSDAEKAVVEYARKVARDAASVTRDDVDNLKSHGFSDEEIFDLAANVAGRAFFTKLLDAVGVLADPNVFELNEDFRHSMTVGKEPDTSPLERLNEDG